MTATSVDRTYKYYGTPTLESFVIKSAAVLKVGALANFDSAGELVDATDAASQRCAGVVHDLPDGTGTGDGTVRAIIARNHCVLLDVAAAARSAAMLDMDACVSDNQTVTDDAATNDIKVGRIAKFEAADLSTAWVHIRNFSGTAAA